MGWLHAIPRSKANPNNTITRQAQFLSEEKEIDMPPCEMPHMINYLFSCGPVCQTGMSSIPLTHQEVYYWLKNTGNKLCVWEINTLREMSRHYLSELVQSDKHDAPPPWVGEIDLEKSKIINDRVKSIFRG